MICGKEEKRMIDIFIPSYHRATNNKTAKYLHKIGYDMSKVHVVIDSEADDVEEYEGQSKRYGYCLHTFDIQEARHRYDFVHRALESRRTAGMARNMFYEIAKDNGIDFYCIMDDDTTHFEIKEYGRYKGVASPDLLISTFDAMKEMMNRHHIGCFGLSQSGDFIGGTNKQLIRWKVMNCTFIDTRFVQHGERAILDTDTTQFVSMYNEGLFTASLGDGMYLHQKQSAVQKGGLTDLYHECKLLAKSIVCPLQYPSAIYAEYQPKNGGRIHHHIINRYLTPKLIQNVGGRDNLAWDTYPEDGVFTLEPKKRTWVFD